MFRSAAAAVVANQLGSAEWKQMMYLLEILEGKKKLLDAKSSLVSILFSLLERWVFESNIFSTFPPHYLSSILMIYRLMLPETLVFSQLPAGKAFRFLSATTILSWFSFFASRWNCGKYAAGVLASSVKTFSDTYHNSGVALLLSSTKRSIMSCVNRTIENVGLKCRSQQHMIVDLISEIVLLSSSLWHLLCRFPSLQHR